MTRDDFAWFVIVTGRLPGGLSQLTQDIELLVFVGPFQRPPGAVLVCPFQGRQETDAGAW